MPWWHLVFAAVVAVTAGLVAVQDLPAWRVGTVLGLLAVLAGAYVLTPAKFDWGRGRLAYLALLFVVSGTAPFLVPTAGILLFAVVSHCYMLMRLRWAVVGTAGLLLATGGANLVGTGLNGAVVATVVIWVVLGMVASLLLGRFIGGIIEQSAQRASLIGELERTRAELAQLSRNEGALAEHERLAREIHDVVAQNLTSMLMLVRAAGGSLARGDQASARQQLALADTAGQEGLRAARDLIGPVGRPEPHDGALVAALGRCCASLGARYGFEAVLDVDGTERDLPVAVSAAVLRAAQECLANVGRHSGARRANVHITFGDQDVVLEVSDDGSGFDAGARTGFGTRQLRARADELGGLAEVLSAPGEGTVARVVLPLPVERPPAREQAGAGPGTGPR